MHRGSCPPIWAIPGSGVGGAPLARVMGSVALEAPVRVAGPETDREGLGEPLTLVVEPLDLADRLDTGRSPEQALGVESCREGPQASHRAQHLRFLEHSVTPCPRIPPPRLAGDTLQPGSSSPR